MSPQICGFAICGTFLRTAHLWYSLLNFHLIGVLFLPESDVECSRISEGRLSDSESAAEENTIRGTYLHTSTLAQQTRLLLTIFIYQEKKLNHCILYNNLACCSVSGSQCVCPPFVDHSHRPAVTRKPDASISHGYLPFFRSLTNPPCPMFLLPTVSQDSL